MNNLDMSVVSRRIKTARRFDLSHLYEELSLGWSTSDFDQLSSELAPYLARMQAFLRSGRVLPSHIPRSGSLAMPIGNSTTPDELFDALGEDVAFETQHFEDCWLTVHYPNPEPVATLVPKTSPGMPRSISLLSERCGKVLDCEVGGPGGAFIAWLLPRFRWAMHTDHENPYEKVVARIHIALKTNPKSFFVWGTTEADRKEHWLVWKHLRPNAAHYVRVDVPHTVVNQHLSEHRVHLILDVRGES